MSKQFVGSEEWCSFPSLGIPVAKARIDSGAKTSSIHAVNIIHFKRNGLSWVSFPLQNDRRTVIRCEAEIIDRRVDQELQRWTDNSRHEVCLSAAS